MLRPMFWVVFIASGTLIASCGAAPEEPAVPTQAAFPVSDSAPAQKLNLDDFAPPGKGRDLLVQNCSTCHSFVCAIRGQRTREHFLVTPGRNRDCLKNLLSKDAVQARSKSADCRLHWARLMVLEENSMEHENTLRRWFWAMLTEVTLVIVAVVMVASERRGFHRNFCFSAGKLWF
ncbi:MAG: hypothetical protein HW374_1845 [Bacteroidetes bacterium]|nr:hypothetical protein [Bacteroidota bacterium]